jgi:hypothetical protein
LTIVALFLTVWAEPLPAVVEVRGVIARDTTWTNDDTILVVDNVTVLDTAHLTIEAGAIVMFNVHKRLSAVGRLTAEGEWDNRIKFTCSADTAGGSPDKALWEGLRFEPNSTGGLDYCDLSYSFTAVYVTRSSPHFQGCIVENFLRKGLHFNGYGLESPLEADVRNCVVRQSDPSFLRTGTGIDILGRVDLDVTYSSVTSCEYGVAITPSKAYAPEFHIAASEISGNAYYGIFTTYG